MVNVFGSPVYSEVVDSAAFFRLLDSILSEKTAAVVILCCDQGSEQRDFLIQYYLRLMYLFLAGFFQLFFWVSKLMSAE